MSLEDAKRAVEIGCTGIVRKRSVTAALCG